MKTITIEVEGGCVTSVSGMPDDWDYIVIDHDILKEQNLVEQFERDEFAYCPQKENEE